MLKVNISALKDQQNQIAKQARFEEKITLDEIKRIAGFSVSFNKGVCVCAAVVLDFKTMKIVEKKFLTTKAQMNHLPGFEAFREGPPICQLYYDLESEPDIIMVTGHGLDHPVACGLATFVGVELGKPTFGAAKSLIAGENRDGTIYINEEIVGKVVKTREHANPIYVSPGHNITTDLAVEIVKNCIIPPHKMPEPLHAAHKYAKKALTESKKENEVEN